MAPHSWHVPALFLALVILTAPVASASTDQSFYYAPSKAMTLQPATIQEPLSAGVTVCVTSACVRHTVPYGHSYTFQASGNARPIHSHFWVKVTQPTAPTPGLGCAIQVFAQVLAPNGDNKWYWNMCVTVDPTAFAQPGTVEVVVDWPADSSPVDVSPGDELYTEVWTASTSTPETATLQLLGDDAGHPSSITLTGTNEPTPDASTQTAQTTSSTSPTSSATSAPPATTTPSTAPHPASTTTTSPAPVDEAARSPDESALPPAAAAPAKASPAVGVLLGAVLLWGAFAARRRLP